jgi:hypothetical protein
VLDHIALGAFLEHPARKDAIPFIVALILHRQLHEGAGFGGIFPRRRLFAGAQANDRAADARGIARLHRQILHQPVALVEQAQHRNAFGHRGRAFDPADFLRHGFGLGDLRDVARRLGLVAAIAAGQRRRREQRDQRGTEKRRRHGAQSAPGRQAS